MTDRAFALWLAAILLLGALGMGICAHRLDAQLNAGMADPAPMEAQ